MSATLLEGLKATDNHGWTSDRGGIPRSTQSGAAAAIVFNAVDVLTTLQRIGIQNPEIVGILSKLKDKEFIAVYNALYQELYKLPGHQISQEQANLLTSFNTVRTNTFPNIKEDLYNYTVLTHNWSNGRSKMLVWTLNKA